jgi:hypothetical protein
LHIRATQPEQREIGDDTVRILLQEIFEHSGGLIVALLVVQVLALGEHGLLGIAGDIAVLHDDGGASQHARFHERCEWGQHERRRQRSCAYFVSGTQGH